MAIARLWNNCIYVWEEVIFCEGSLIRYIHSKIFPYIFDNHDIRSPAEQSELLCIILLHYAIKIVHTSRRSLLLPISKFPSVIAPALPCLDTLNSRSHSLRGRRRFLSLWWVPVDRTAMLFAKWGHAMFEYMYMIGWVFPCPKIALCQSGNSSYIIQSLKTTTKTRQKPIVHLLSYIVGILYNDHYMLTWTVPSYHFMYWGANIYEIKRKCRHQKLCIMPDQSRARIILCYRKDKFQVQKRSSIQTYWVGCLMIHICL